MVNVPLLKGAEPVPQRETARDDQSDEDTDQKESPVRRQHD